MPMKFRLKSVDSSVSIPSWFDLKDYFGSNHRLNSFGSYIIGVNFLRYNALIYTIMVYQLVCIIGGSSDVLIQNSRKIALQCHLKCWQTITLPLIHPKFSQCFPFGVDFANGV